jgi:uncharacterized protein (UPF0548 family)
VERTTYSGIQVERADNQIIVYVTNLARGRELLKAARVADNRVVLHVAPFSRSQLVAAAANALHSRPARDLKIVAAAPAPGATGVIVWTSKSRTTAWLHHVQATLQPLVNVPITADFSSPISPANALAPAPSR